MYRKMFTGMICLMLLGIFFVPKGRADLADRKTIVTVKESIQIPGKCFPQAPTCSSCWISTIHPRRDLQR